MEQQVCPPAFAAQNATAVPKSPLAAEEFGNSLIPAKKRGSCFDERTNAGNGVSDIDSQFVPIA